MKHRQCAPSYNQAAIRGRWESRDGVLDLARIAHVDRAHLQPKRRCRGRDRAELADASGYSGIPKDGHPRVTLGAISLSSSSHFAPMPYSEWRKSSGIAARVYEAIYVAGADGIGDECKYDRYGPVACSNRPTVALPVARMTSGSRATNSAAYLRI